jgi:hypothetical protein
MSFDLKNKSFEHLTRKESEHFNDESDNQDDYSTITIPSSAGELLHAWRALEYEVYEKSARWYFFGAIFMMMLITYALFTNGAIMAITFILLGIVGFIHLQKDPRIITFAITSKGIVADKQFYQYDNIFSFWIFYDTMHTKSISLHTKASILPFIHIPLQDEDPVMIRELLLRNIPEIKQDPSLIDTLERVLHI